MLPINVQPNQYIKKEQPAPQNEQKEQEKNKKKTATSQQAIANGLVLSSMPANPNVAPMTQGTMAQ